METCILIPREFSTVLKAFATPPSPKHTPRKKGLSTAGLPASAAVEELRSRHWDFNRKRPKLNTLPKKVNRKELEMDNSFSTTTTTIPSPTSSPEPMEADMDEPPKPTHQVLRPIPVYSPLEMGATIWANVPLYPGQVFYPDKGEIRLDRLEIYNKLPRYDVRYKFGCIDEIQEVEEREVRHCNWVRFVQSTRCIDDVNIVAIKVREHTVYQVVKLIRPNTELKVFFDETNLEFRIASPKTVIQSYKSAFNPVTISPPTIQLPRTCPSSPESEASLRSLLTPPSDREDDTKSTFSDITVASSDSKHDDKNDSTQQKESKEDHETKDDTKPTVLEIVPHESPVVPSVSPQPHSPGGPTDSPVTPEVRLLSSMETPSPIVPSTKSPPSSAETIGYGIPSSLDVKPNLLHASPTFPSADNELTPARGTVKRNRERTWLPCEVCGKKFDRPSLLRRHMRTHTGEKPHACDVCGKAFSTSSSLNTHRRIHSGEKPHQCQICGKRFTASSNLYYHKMTHNKEKPHKCSLCSKSFPTPGDLKSHMYVHNGSWPFKCDICNRGFSKQTNLKNHMLLHSGDKPHACPLCGKRFALQCNLKTHLKTHEGDPQDECFKCGRVFLSSSRQVVHGYCRECLSTGNVKSPMPHRPTAFSVESLAASSEHKSTPSSHAALDFSTTPPQGGRHTSGGSMRIPGSSPMSSSGLPMRGFGHFPEPKPGALPRGFPVPGGPGMHPAAGMMHYGAVFPWPKLVQQPY